MDDDADDQSHVDWRAWGPEAFAAAAAADRPICLSLVATWCGDCHRMDAETFAEPRVAAALADGFVPVRVDVDRRPRVRDRYNVGGFPSTVFCTPDGEVLTGATYLGPDGFRQVVDRVRETYAERGDAAGRVPRGLDDETPPAGPIEDVEGALVARLDEAFDERHGGWGSAPKFPLPGAIRFALKRRRDQAVRTADAVRDRLADPVEGGFFRYATGADWSAPAHEKLLADNAALIRALADAYLATGADRLREPAADAVDFLVETLWTGAGFGGSVGPAAGRDYYARDAAGRAEARDPRTDLTAFAGANALAADALLAYHAYTDDERAREYARRALEAVRGLVDDGVVTRYRAGDDEPPAPTGVLEDQARVAGAFATAAQVLGPDAWLDVARAVADHALDALRDPGGPFRDGPVDPDAPGLLSRPLRPLDGTVEMASALVDLAALAREPRYRTAAREAVGSFAGAADRMGPQVAGFGTVAARCARPPLTIRVGTPPGSDLHRAALRVADHEKVVRPAATVPDGTAVVGGGDDRPADEGSEPASTPDDLMARVADWHDGAA